MFCRLCANDHRPYEPCDAGLGGRVVLLCADCGDPIEGNPTIVDERYALCAGCAAQAPDETPDEQRCTGCGQTATAHGCACDDY